MYPPLFITAYMIKVILFQKNIPALCENHRYSLWKAVRVNGFLPLFYRNRHEGLKNTLFPYGFVRAPVTKK